MIISSTPQRSAGCVLQTALADIFSAIGPGGLAMQMAADILTRELPITKQLRSRKIGYGRRKGGNTREERASQKT